jgi:hypothetical protein
LPGLAQKILETCKKEVKTVTFKRPVKTALSANYDCALSGKGNQTKKTKTGSKERLA